MRICYLSNLTQNKLLDGELIQKSVNLFRANPTKMFKHTQTIRRQFPDELFGCV